MPCRGILCPGERFFDRRVRAHVEHARLRIGGEHGTQLSLESVVRGVTIAESASAREGIRPGRPEAGLETWCVRCNPAVDGCAFGEQEPVARVARVISARR